MASSACSSGVVTSNEGPWQLLFLVTTTDDGQRVTGGRCSTVCSLNRYHLKPSNRKGERAKGNEVTSFLYRLLKITPTHMKTGPREDTYAHYRKNSGPRSNRRTLMEKRERDIESGLRRQVEKMGGKFMKFTSPGNDGVPDRNRTHVHGGRSSGAQSRRTWLSDQGRDARFKRSKKCTYGRRNRESRRNYRGRGHKSTDGTF